ncbi:amino acid/amide ABC transporter membrane protein 1, HAAT family [Actinokineospora alba]|uniref:Amino acid/amide ABC transporter membrane protein 1, HAAT family n=1 Tax=Actinokineospora alba TaxID=504798 RepID=A0A1H0IB71_9PSEU|nr:branched-chain amino acid ABC transporter permease [Actinokineospora alba]TDP71017.1 amino acid/amide ABC transporter membrane protein 1 (HAAT family) [Actinokineospora alba]SDI87853.1 branched-chain amino acid transport system permease protein [Actinokineospora alba]SDO28500.1 amino acid/amide ABC transporter membrane protein 1, HAAT family [Actinokineospora alba]
MSPELTAFLTNCFAGLALGSTYALVALGFVVIYKSTGVINFAQGGLLALGAYLGYTFSDNLALAFGLSILFACLAAAFVGAGFERIVLRRMVGQPPFAVIMITIGLLFIIEPILTSIWGFDNLQVPNPWNIQTVEAGGLVFGVRDLWTIGITIAVVTAFFLFFRFSGFGLAMRATAFDPEAALAQGISAKKVYAVSWAIAAALAALAGITLAAGPGGLSPSIGFIALAAFPAMILGGMDSPAGAVLGGIVIGLAEALTRGYQDQLFSWAGDNVSVIVPYLLMIVILLIRPYGLLGTKDVRRI